MQTDYDVVIIGGGIHGAGVAQAASAGGYSVLLLEQSGIASGTSSRSSKLIHGGLRYLESMEFSLVRESLSERRLLLKLAPDLVRLVPFYIPVYKTTRRRPWQIGLGLGLYSLLGGMADDNKFRAIPGSQWDKLDGLSIKDLQAVYCYQDGQTDDVLLTQAVVRSAQSLGAEVVVPGQFVRAQWSDKGVEFEYRDETGHKNGRARVLVNAAGPWVNQVRENILPVPPGKQIELVQGTHINVSGPIQSGIFYLEAPQDGRAVFVMPRGGAILVGTTEKIYQGPPMQVVPTEEEKQYLIDVLVHYFPQFDLPDSKIINSSFSGLRVLPAGQGQAFRRSRETILVINDKHSPRLLNIYGGKLTTYRSTAEKVMGHFKNVLPSASPRAVTSQLALSPD